MTNQHKSSTGTLIANAGATRSSQSGQRRASSDQRKRDAGEIRINAWLPTACITALDRLVAHWGGDRTQAIEGAIHHLAQQTDNGLVEVDAPAWSADGRAGNGGEAAVVGLRVPRSLVAVLDRAGAAAGHESRSESALVALGYVGGVLAKGGKFSPKV